jgi:hypothetical protein
LVLESGSDSIEMTSIVSNWLSQVDLYHMRSRTERQFVSFGKDSGRFFSWCEYDTCLRLDVWRITMMYTGGWAYLKAKQVRTANLHLESCTRMKQKLVKPRKKLVPLVILV